MLPLDYEGEITERIGKQRVSCSPGFYEELQKPPYTFYNSKCRCGLLISPHVRMRVTFDSHIMKDFKAFERQVYSLLEKIFIDKERRGS